MARDSRMLGPGFIESVGHSSVVGSFFMSSIVLLSIFERRIPIFRLATYFVVRSLETLQEQSLQASVPLLSNLQKLQSQRALLWGISLMMPNLFIMTRRLLVYRSGSSTTMLQACYSPLLTRVGSARLAHRYVSSLFTSAVLLVCACVRPALSRPSWRLKFMRHGGHDDVGEFKLVTFCSGGTSAQRTDGLAFGLTLLGRIVGGCQFLLVSEIRILIRPVDRLEAPEDHRSPGRFVQVVGTPFQPATIIRRHVSHVGLTEAAEVDHVLLDIGVSPFVRGRVAWRVSRWRFSRGSCGKREDRLTGRIGLYELGHKQVEHLAQHPIHPQPEHVSWSL